MEDFEYYRYAINKKESKQYFNALLQQCPWSEGYYQVNNMKVKSPRLMCWFGKDDAWPTELKVLKALVEDITKSEFNAALLNLYRNGNDSVGWHSDQEVKWSTNPIVASLSLGAARKFMIKEQKGKKNMMFVLESGDLFIMKRSFQRNWFHAIPKMPTADGPRINVTFRHVHEKLVELDNDSKDNIKNTLRNVDKGSLARFV